MRFLGGRRLTQELGEEFIKHLEEKGNRPSSINRHIGALKCYFRFKAMDFKIHGVKTKEHHTRILQDREWENLISTAKKPMYDRNLPDAARRRAKLELALLYSYCGGGLRCSEATRIKVEDLVVILQLKGLGFFERGKAGEFLDSHDLTFSGDFPLNTGGGELSGGQAGSAGTYLPVVEAIRQLKGEAYGHQVPGAKTALVSVPAIPSVDVPLSYAAAMVLQRR